MTNYLVIGGGRVARHFRHYFGLEALSFETWTRTEGRRALLEKAERSSHVLLLISDSAINEFLSDHPELQTKTCVHFSGSIVSPLAASAHPLMTFTKVGHEEFYSLEDYRRIPFITESTRTGTELLPGLQNPFFRIEAELKPLYHALCVLSGNLTTLLWEKAFAEFDSQLGLPKEVLLPYLAQVMRNLSHSLPGQSVLTGPIARRDVLTINRNLEALAGDPFKNVYRAVVSAHDPSLGVQK